MPRDLAKLIHFWLLEECDINERKLLKTLFEKIYSYSGTENSVIKSSIPASALMSVYFDVKAFSRAVDLLASMYDRLFYVWSDQKVKSEKHPFLLQGAPIIRSSRLENAYSIPAEEMLTILTEIEGLQNKPKSAIFIDDLCCVRDGKNKSHLLQKVYKTARTGKIIRILKDSYVKGEDPISGSEIGKRIVKLYGKDARLTAEAGGNVISSQISQINEAFYTKTGYKLISNDSYGYYLNHKDFEIDFHK